MNRKQVIYNWQKKQEEIRYYEEPVEVKRDNNGYVCEEHRKLSEYMKNEFRKTKRNA